MAEQIIAPPCEEPEDLSDCVVDDGSSTIPSGCIETPSGIKCPDTTPSDVCKPFQLSNNQDECIIEDYVEEALGIGGAPLNIYKMLGVHEQGLLVDQTGNGTPISGGSATNFPAANAFDQYISAWRSLQKGIGVTQSSFIGYDFGTIKLQNGRDRYGEPKDVTLDVSTIRIKQVSNPNNRVTRARVERSQDGQKWYGVDIVDLPDCDKLVTVHFRRSVPSRCWRLRPIEFSGGDTDFWGVAALELIDYEETDISNVQDRLFLENKNRDYQTPAVQLKGSYDLIDVQTELSRFGIELPSQTYYITISFQQCVRLLGRPVVIGDVIEMPSETQYSATLEPIKKYMEVTDVGWSTEGYTPGWKPTLLRVIAQPMLASQETQDIFGDLVGQVDSSGLFDEDDGNHPVYQDYSEIGQTIEEQAVQEERTPQRGRDAGNQIGQFSDEQVQAAADVGINITKIGLNPTGLYVEDALPPNGEDFTMGDTFPTSFTDGDYHRLTYSGLAEDVPDRLYRYSSAKGRWVYLETDRRHEFDGQKKKLQEFIVFGTQPPPPKQVVEDTIVTAPPFGSPTGGPSPSPGSPTGGSPVGSPPAPAAPGFVLALGDSGSEGSFVGSIYTSDNDVTTWTGATIKPNGPVTNAQGLVYGESIDTWVAVTASTAGGNQGYQNYSTDDGATWRIAPRVDSYTGAANARHTSVTWSPTLERFVCGGSSSTQFQYSDDGITWVSGTAAGPNMPFKQIHSVHWSAGLSLFLAGTGDSFSEAARLATSADGITWSDVQGPYASDIGDIDVVYSVGTRIFVGTDRGEIWYSDNNGASWTESLYDVATTIGDFGGIAANSDGSIIVAGGVGFNDGEYVWRSVDNGVNFTRIDVNSQLAGTPFNQYAYGLIYDPDYGFIQVGRNATTNEQLIITSPDGLTWTTRLQEKLLQPTGGPGSPNSVGSPQFSLNRNELEIVASKNQV